MWNSRAATGHSDKRPYGVLTIGLALTLAALAAGCGSASSKEPPSADSISAISVSTGRVESIYASLPEAVKKSRIISATYNPEHPPQGFLDTNGKYVGYTADLSRALGAVMGVEIKYDEFQKFASLIPSLQSGRFDVSHFNDTAEREQILVFVDFMETGTSILVPKGNPKGLSVDSLCGTSTAAPIGGLQATQIVPELSAKCVAAGKPQIDLKRVPGENDAILALKSNRVDSVVGDSPTLLYVVSTTKGFDIAGEPLVDGLLGYAFKKGSPLAEPLSQAFDVLHRNGTYDRILKKWNVEQLAMPRIIINGAGK